MSDEKSERTWVSGLLMGAGYTFVILGILAFSHSFDPVGSMFVGGVFFALGWLLKRYFRPEENDE